VSRYACHRTPNQPLSVTIQNPINRAHNSLDGHAQNAFRPFKLGTKVAMARLAGHFFAHDFIRIRRPWTPVRNVRRTKDYYAWGAGRGSDMRDAAVIADEQVRARS
jgi:hypothetical protein